MHIHGNLNHCNLWRYDGLYGLRTKSYKTSHKKVSIQTPYNNLLVVDLKII